MVLKDEFIPARATFTKIALDFIELIRSLLMIPFVSLVKVSVTTMKSLSLIISSTDAICPPIALTK